MKRAFFFLLFGSALVACGGKTVDSADDTGVAPPDTNTDSKSDVPESTIVPDIDAPAPSCMPPVPPDDPPIACGPKESGAPKCGLSSKDTCPTSNACMAPVEQSGDLLRHRISRLRAWYPDALLAITAIAIDPNVNPSCFNGGAESLNWLLRIDRKASTLTTGAAHKSTDGKTYTFANEPAGSPSVVCPGFVGSTTPLTIASATTPITFSGDVFTSTPIPFLAIPIFETGGGGMVLPFREVIMKNARLSAGGTCIGNFDRDYWCDGDTLGWTTGGALLAKISIDDADHVPVKSAGCQSLCAILVNDLAKTTKSSAGHTVCKRNPDGTYPELGDTCLGSGSCKNAFRFTATFASYGVAITP